jgi:hypothetical protein
MKRYLPVLAVALALAPSSSAGELQNELKSRWLGAWVIVTTESYSDCSGNYTNNRINVNLVKSSGQVRFQAGELAKLDRVDLKRSRLDLLMTLYEPALIPYVDGPFTLYREAECRIELEVEVPRELVKGKSVEAVEERLFRVVERYATEEEARASDSYNGREIDSYPDDYETTLARHAVWKAEQVNASVQAQIDHALEEAARLADRMDEDPVYLRGFSEGVQLARAIDLDSCPVLLAVDLGQIRRQAARAKADETGVEAELVRGFEDGKVLVYGLEMLRNLPACFVPVPESDDDYHRSASRP